MRLQMMLTKPTDTALTYNVPYADLSRPSQGPTNPFKTTEGNALKRKNVLTGYAEEAAISDATFTNQHRTFQSRGYAQEPNANGALVGDLASAEKYEGRDIVQMKSLRAKRQRQNKGTPSIVDGEGRYLGPWAKYQEEVQYEDEAALAEEELASDEEYVDESVAPVNMAPMKKAATDYQDDHSNQETTEFNGTSLVDYQGRSYMHAPRDIDIDLYKEQGLERTFHPKYVPLISVSALILAVALTGIQEAHTYLEAWHKAYQRSSIYSFHKSSAPVCLCGCQDKDIRRLSRPRTPSNIQRPYKIRFGR